MAYSPRIESLRGTAVPVTRAYFLIHIRGPVPTDGHRQNRAVARAGVSDVGERGTSPLRQLSGRHLLPLAHPTTLPLSLCGSFPREQDRHLWGSESVCLYQGQTFNLIPNAGIPRHVGCPSPQHLPSRVCTEG